MCLHARLSHVWVCVHEKAASTILIGAKHGSLRIQNTSTSMLAEASSREAPRAASIASKS